MQRYNTPEITVRRFAEGSVITASGTGEVTGKTSAQSVAEQMQAKYSLLKNILVQNWNED